MSALAGGNHAHCIVYACRRLDIHIQTFLGEVTLLLRFVQKCVQSIRIPVEHNGQVLQIIAAAVCRIRLVRRSVRPQPVSSMVPVPEVQEYAFSYMIFSLC